MYGNTKRIQRLSRASARSHRASTTYYFLQSRSKTQALADVLQNIRIVSCAVAVVPDARASYWLYSLASAFKFPKGLS